MNLAQAYQGWQQLSENRELYIKTKEAFRKAWFTLPTNKACSYYTKEILGEALAATREVESNKARAASIMVHVLNFANWAEPKWNPKPDFTFEDLMEYTKGPLADPAKIGKKPDIEESLSDEEREDKGDTPEMLMVEEPVEIVEPVIEEEPVIVEQMETQRNLGTLAKEVCQLDPQTLKVIRKFDSISQAQRETGACNLDRVIRKHSKSVGCYWCYPQDVENFKPAERARPGRVKKESGEQKSAIKKEAQKVIKPIPQDEGHLITLNSLQDVSNADLIEELKRRGFKGTLTYSITLEL